jgi:hypothetical protein
MATHQKKKGKKKENGKSRKKQSRERHTPNTTHPGLLGLLSYAEIVLAGPVHGLCRGKRMNQVGARKAREGKGT